MLAKGTEPCSGCEDCILCPYHHGGVGTKKLNCICKPTEPSPKDYSHDKCDPGSPMIEHCKPTGDCPYHDLDTGVKISNCTCKPTEPVDTQSTIRLVKKIQKAGEQGWAFTDVHKRVISDIRQLAAELKDARDLLDRYAYSVYYVLESSDDFHSDVGLYLLRTGNYKKMEQGLHATTAQETDRSAEVSPRRGIKAPDPIEGNE